MKDYIILVKGQSELDYSKEELQKRVDEYQKWIADISINYIGGQRLEKKGVHIKNKKSVFIDGPFLESKEIIAGFVMIKANDLHEATEIAKSSPLLNYFELIVRPIVEEEN